MKYTTAITFLLAFGPVTTILAAPVTQDSNSALSASPAAGGQGEGAKQPAGGSSSQGMSGASSGNEGVLDKVEKIVKDVLGGLRKRGVVDELGDVVEKTLDSTSKLLNGEKSGSQSAYSTQSTDPDAMPATAPKSGSGDDKKDDDKQAQPAAAPASSGDDSSSSDSGISKFLGGRSLTDQVDPVNTSGTTAPISNALPAEPSAAAPATKQSAPVAVAPLDTQKQNTQEEKKEQEGPNNGTPTTDPFLLTPEEIEALKTVLASQPQGQGAGQGVPGMSDA